MTASPNVRQWDRVKGAADIRVGLAGYGLAGAVFHGPLIAATPGLQLTLVATSNIDRATAARRDHPGVDVVPDADALISRAGELDLLVVATPNASHATIAAAALDAGVNVVIDKPFATTAREGEILVARAAAARRFLSVFHNRRWDGDFLTVRRVIAERAVGDVHRFESGFERWKPEPRSGWKNERAAPASGVLYDLGPHLIDQALVLFGAVVSVHCVQRTIRGASAVIDDVTLDLTHRNGIVSRLTMSLASADPGPRFRVLGRAGSFTKHGLDVQEDSLRLGARPGDATWGEDPSDAWGRLSNGSATRAVPTERGAYERYYEGIVASLRAGAPAPVDPDDAIAGLRIIAAADVSANEGRVVEVS